MDVASLCVMLLGAGYGVFICTRNYFAPSSRFEDYYLLLALISIFAEFSIEAYIVFANNLIPGLIAAMHGLEFMAYWFFLMFIMKQYAFKTRKIERLHNLIFVMMEIAFITGAAMHFGILAFPPMDAALPITIRVQMISVPGLDIWLETAQIVVCLFGLLFLVRIKKFPCMNYAMFSVLINEVLHMVNMIFFGNTSVWLFNIETTISATSMALVLLAVQQYFRQRTTFKNIGKN